MVKIVDEGFLIWGRCPL